MPEIRHASLTETEERLRAEIEELKRRLSERHGGHGHGHGHGQRKRPSGLTLTLLAILIVAVFGAAFFKGYLPNAQRQTALAKAALDESTDLPGVNVAEVTRATGKSELVLTGNIQAVTEAPVLARATGYIQKRYVDIGDRVKEGQVVAEIVAPDLDQQVRQAKAGVDQAAASLEQSSANLQQGKTNAEMARLTSDRWGSLVTRGAVARQDADTYLSQYEAQKANVQALEKGVSAARSNVGAAEANLARLTEMQGFLAVRAPFDGVITVRNVDTGALVNDGNTMLFRIAQTDRLRIYVNVPQSDANAIRVGMTARLTVADLSSKSFNGVVTRTANALDPATRTLLAEVQVPNTSGQLLPGMYSEVDFTTPRAEPPLIIRADTLVVRANGPQVAVIGDDGIVHYKLINLGRDYGDRMEVLSGISAGDRVAINPGDSVREGAKVNAKLLTRGLTKN
jgi:RND family efflux transporter MFP subunit